MNDRYLEIDSTYRDRNRWPLASEFEIPISQTGGKDKFNAFDPISFSATNKIWISDSFSEEPKSLIISLTVDLPLTGLGGDNVYIVTATASAGQLQRVPNYYINAVARYAGPPEVNNRISAYRYLGGDRGEFTFKNAWSRELQSGDTFLLIDPTSTTPSSAPVFFVPDGAVGENGFANSILYNETIDQYRQQSFFDNVTSILTINTSTSTTGTVNSGPITGWSNTDTYSIRLAPPSATGTLTGDIVNNPTTHTSFILPLIASNQDLVGDFLEIKTTMTAADRSGALVTGGISTITLSAGANNSNDFFIGDTIRMTSGASSGITSTITRYDGTTKVASVFPGFITGTTPGDTYFITQPIQSRRIVKYVEFIGGAAGSGVATSINLPVGASNISGDYINIYIRITSGAAVGDVRLIQSYVVTTISGATTRKATPYVPFSGIVVTGDTFEITSGIVSPGFLNSIALQNFLLLPFARDNLVPFVYTGSTVSQQEAVCYEIKLLNIVLPNQTLISGTGSRISFYPYVYIEITNVSGASAGMKNVIYSNNPNSSKMVFRAAVDDISNLIDSAFVKLSGDSMTQTLKFKPNDNLKFSIRLSNGNIYDTVVEENYSPLHPNPLVQISALFSLRRLS